jgi:hypothetical protein
MIKGQTLAKRYGSMDMSSVVMDLRRNPPVQTGDEGKKLLKVLAKDSCPVGMQMWAAFFGTIDMKLTVARNVSAATCVHDALMLDAETSPWYVFDVLAHEGVFLNFMRDVYGSEATCPDAENLEDLISGSMTTELEKQWAQLIPKQGHCETMQSELVRILWRFGRTLNYMVAYKLHYDDQMFLVLNDAVDSIEGISVFSRNVLRAFLRWSQLKQRSGNRLVPSHGYERYDPVNVVVDVYLRKFKLGVPFDGSVVYKEQ